MSAGAGGSSAAGTTGTGEVNTGGFVSTSSTVLRIIGNSLRDFSFNVETEAPELEAGASVDGGVDDGLRLILRGVNRSGTEYQCIKGYAIFDGPDSEESVKAMKSWKINAVRIPLNETCWLAPEDSPITLNPKFTGVAYKTAIQKYVALLHKYDMYPSLDLHWAAPNGMAAQNLLPMPDVDHAATFWKDVAVTFTEFGENDCASTKVVPWMDWWDRQQLGYLAWTWNVYGSRCLPTTSSTDGNPWPLIQDFTTAAPMGDPGGFAHAVRNRFVAISP